MKRAHYDQFGDTGGNSPGTGPAGPGGPGFEGFDFSDYGSSTFRDFFENLFSGGGIRGAQEAGGGPERGEDLQYSMSIGFEDAVHGVQARIRVNRLVACEACSATGRASGGKRRPCPACGGTGRGTVQRGFMKFSGGCPACGGSGKAPGEPCRACGGQGAAQISDLITVRIPAGVDNGSKVRVPGRGNAGRNGGPPGDLYIVIEVAPHAFFRREGANILIRVPITVPEATLGAKIEVPTLWGKTTIRIPPGTKSGQKFRIKEQGAPLPGRKGRGDEHAEVYIVPPPFEDERVREMMKELEKISGPNPRGTTGMS
ncbi:MAG: molecular chaperone DnaJ [Candidatus Aminicenantes bacterium]|nr:molecular chaperone DnaJ [Candidatus Aminicenantes bacterium]